MRNSKKNVAVITLGCPKNLVDSEVMAGSLIKAGFQVVTDVQKATVVIVNTCGFIADAKQESLERIFDVVQLKNQGKIEKIIVAGCLVQRYKEALSAEIPEVDGFVGTGDFQNIVAIVKEINPDRKNYYQSQTFLANSLTPRINSQPFYRAYLKISDGCRKNCAFCIIPKIRGKLQSRQTDDIIKEARNLVKTGLKELIIISHDFTDYGYDLRKKDPHSNPVNLLNKLCEIDDLKWLRILYLYPDGFNNELLKVFKKQEKILNYFDLPLQHINNDVLKNMRRKTSRQHIEKMLSNIRNNIENAKIRTQFIVGFPGETAEQFSELMTFVKEQKFDHVGCFKFSPEEDTLANSLAQQVSDQEKNRRHNALMKLQKTISRKNNKRYINEDVEVMIEGVSKESPLLLEGRTWWQAPEIDGITYINDGYANVGQIVKVRITQTMDYDLVGHLL